MDHLVYLRDTIFGYLSPAKSRRRTTVLPIAPSSPSKHKTPNRPSRYDVGFSEPADARTKAVIKGRVSKKYLSPSDTRRQRQIAKTRGSQSSSDSEDDGKEDDANLTVPDKNSDYTSSSSSGIQTPVEPRKIIGSIELDEHSISVEDKVSKFLEHQRAAIEQADEGGEDWHEAEHALFNELKMRGFQPLLPACWRSDFRTVPPALFSYDVEDTFLNSASGNEFRGSTALLSLVSLGSRVRSILTGSRTQEEVIKKEIENYIKWAEFDGGYLHKKFIPITAIVASTPGQDIGEISTIMTDQLEFLAAQHRSHLLVEDSDTSDSSSAPTLYIRTPPLLYGVVIAGAKVIFVTYDSAKDDSKPRTIAHFDFNVENMDVWNGFAVAIMVVFVRNYMISIRENLDDDDDTEASDPDA